MVHYLLIDVLLRIRLLQGVVSRYQGKELPVHGQLLKYSFMTTLNSSYWPLSCKERLNNWNRHTVRDLVSYTLFPS